MASSSKRKARKRGGGPSGPLAPAFAAAGRQNCLLCGRLGPGYVGAWRPTPEVGRRLASRPGRTVLVRMYKLCSDCGRRAPALGDRIEEALIQAGRLAPAAN